MPPNVAYVKETVIFEAAKFSYRPKPDSIAKTRGKTSRACELLANQERGKQLTEPIGTQGQRLARETSARKSQMVWLLPLIGS